MNRTLALATLCLSLSTAALAQTVTPAPSLLNYQGRIATPNGNPVPDPPSSLPYTLRLSLWDAATGGTKKWEQTITVRTKNGTFSALLDLGANAGDILSGNVWMETKVGNDAPLAPRQQIVSVAYALKANTVPDNSITTTKIADGSVTAAKLANGAGFSLPYAGAVSSSAQAFSVTNNGTAAGIVGTSNQNAGVVGFSTNGGGVDAYTFNGHGMYGVNTSTGNYGVLGTNSNGIYGFTSNGGGETVNGAGVYGASNTATGVRGVSTNNIGVKGDGGTVGVYGASPTGYGIVGQSDSGWSVYSFGRTGSVGGYFDTSDARYKTNINPLENPLNTILSMRGVSYDWKRDEFKSMNFGAGRQIGFLAQELEKVLPELVHTDAKGYKSVNYSHVVPVLVEAVKTLNAKVDRLSNAEKKNIELEARIKQLEAMMERLNAEKR